ncbi:putative zinc protease, partial [termite gut metagenome]
EGSHKYNSAEIAEKLDYYGAWLELSCSLEHSYITLYTLTKYFVQTLDILESMIKESLFPEKELETVCATNIRQFQVNLSKIDYVAQRRIMSAMYGEQHPCGMLIETDDYNKITPDTLLEFYNRYYHSANCSLFISGKVTNEIIHCIESVFGTETFGTDHSKPEVKTYSPLPVSEKQIFVAHNEREMQTAVRLGQFIITRKHPDYPKMRVLITLLGGYFGSRLMSNIRENKGYTYGISADTFFCSESGLLLIAADTAPEYLQPLIKEIYFEIERLQTELVTPQELSNVRNYMLGDMYRNYESAFSLSDAWIFIKNSGLDDTYFSRIVGAVKEITPTEIRDLACRYLCKENIKELVVGKFS